ncbi:MAG: glycoside hydrolase family 38 C-terminal domain-containing protein, partial [Eubacteriales bacterium]
GFFPHDKTDTETISRMEKCFASRLPNMEQRYPYDIWLLASYNDDQRPSVDQTDLFSAWNAKWKYPKICTLGNPDIPFELVREKYSDQIPVLKGEITGGWYQHPVSTAELLADKLEADRRLANAETYASMAALSSKYLYPVQNFTRAWEYLFWNDEHSYGTSGYQGRRVYETWMQHRDWIEKSSETADVEINAALDAITRNIKTDVPCVAVFNPTARTRDERITVDGKEAVVCGIPPCGYKTVQLCNMISVEIEDCATPPTIENEYYKISFSRDGSMKSIFDKLLKRELIDNSIYGANCFVYTEDNHHSFVKPEKAKFRLSKKDGVIAVTAMMDEPYSGASIIQTVTLDNMYHRIDIDNRLEHVRAMVNTNRYNRYIYYAFPFTVKNARRICQLNGCEAEYAKTLTGHGTDTYMSAHEWALVENNDYGIALLQRDTLLVEFDHIHPDKTDCGAAGEGSAIYSYVANDWLQMHQVGGSHVNFHLRYGITSWSGSYQEAGLREMAECWVNPVTIKPIRKQNGVLPTTEYSFLTVPNNQRLICLKRADDGRGLIARLYGQRSNAVVSMNDARIENCGTDETSFEGHPDGYGYSTLRIDIGELPKRENTLDFICESKPAPIGSVWTGLITKPRAFRGENQGHLYLLWGQNMEKNLSHYELYRSETQNFEPSLDTFIAKVEPGIYRVGRYIDEGLKQHTKYFYRVRAVNKEGTAGDFSDEFSGITKE